jgi:hypothetical protein
MKTTFSSGVIVTSQWLNGSQQIYFDGQDLDWHYNPLGLSSLITAGPDGLDSRYVTLSTDQPALSSAGLYVSGAPINGSKVVVGEWFFGYNPAVVGNPANDINTAPRSYTTNEKYQYAGGIPTPTTPQKLQSLDAADLVTKEILQDQIDRIQSVIYVDNGIYYSEGDPTCYNYSQVGASEQVCPL